MCFDVQSTGTSQRHSLVRMSRIKASCSFPMTWTCLSSNSGFRGRRGSEGHTESSSRPVCCITLQMALISCLAASLSSFKAFKALGLSGHTTVDRTGKPGAHGDRKLKSEQTRGYDYLA